MSVLSNSYKILLNIKETAIKFLLAIKKSLINSNNGDENLYVMLWAWGILPAILVVFFLDNKLKRFGKIIACPIAVLIILFFSWHIFAIMKTIKKHPEYKEKKEDKKEKYKGLSDKQIKELKIKERKKENLNLLKKAMLLKSWDSMEFYKIVILVDGFVILTQIQRILYIL
jgi:glucan phosphoethanolaminetransferase (alkaline phosphatase superfamily)